MNVKEKMFYVQNECGKNILLGDVIRTEITKVRKTDWNI